MIFDADIRLSSSSTTLAAMWFQMPLDNPPRAVRTAIAAPVQFDACDTASKSAARNELT